MTRTLTGLLLVLTLMAAPAAPDTYVRQPGIDAISYAYHLTLRDDTDEIAGEAIIDLRFIDAGVREVRLDLVSAASRADGKGMTVDRVTSGETSLAFRHEGEALRISVADPPKAGERRQFTIRYHGVAAAGLRIGPNKHKDRTFFSDNWPNLARHWLPAIDHPSDKAACEFIVTAPSQYQVVSNGRLVEESDLAGGMRRTHWKQSVPIPDWLFVLGAARFAVQHLGDAGGVPLQTWVYAQDRDAGFYDFAEPSRHVLEFYSDAIGPYSYEKLANVQSASAGGGMEAATAIFYGENLVTGQRADRIRNVVIHEIAHQWWGNAVTESDWDDVWLSEGFATYFTLLFREHAYGRDDFVAGLIDSRKRVLDFHAKTPDYRIVHDNLADMRQVTTSQTYQKGSWVLHMLRGIVGDEAFWRGIRAYYARHRDANATTADFRRAMEEASGRSLDTFFRQWLYRSGIPRIEGAWRYEAGALTIELKQTQPGDPFDLTIPIAVAVDGVARPRRETIRVSERAQTVRIPLDKAPREVVLDPDLWVLMDATLSRR